MWVSRAPASGTDLERGSRRADPGEFMPQQLMYQEARLPKFLVMHHASKVDINSVVQQHPPLQNEYSLVYIVN